MNELSSSSSSSFLSIFVCRSLSPLFLDNGSAYFLEARTRPSLFSQTLVLSLVFSPGHSILGGGQGLRLHCVSWKRRARPTSNQGGMIHQSKNIPRNPPNFEDYLACTCIFTKNFIFVVRSRTLVLQCYTIRRRLGLIPPPSPSLPTSSPSA